MPEPRVESPYTYTPDYIAEILQSVKTIAMVGASGDKTRPSNNVLRVMHEAGYDMLPINPNPELTEIHGIKVYNSMEEVDRPIDMVQVFRRKEALYEIAQQAIDVGAKVLWAQLGVYDDKAATLATDAGLSVVMDRCPKIELALPS